ncbi:MAG: hypothetical protein ACK5Z4_13335 [Planctomyces sp.]|jgi:hypothetical protein
MKWDRCWISAFLEGPHMDGWRGGLRVARVVSLRQVAGIPVMRNRSGRKRRLYLAMANRGRGWEAVGVYGTAKKARQEAERALGEVVA